MAVSIQELGDRLRAMERSGIDAAQMLRSSVELGSVTADEARRIAGAAGIGGW